MNKKGFTLVELLAVIIILSLLALLASTSVTKIVKDSKGELYDTQIKLIKSAAEAWGADNLGKLPDAGSCKYLLLGDLKEYGLLDNNIVNTKTNEKFSNELIIKIISEKNDYGLINTYYEVDSKEIDNCEKVYQTCNLISGEPNKVGSKYQCKVKYNMEEGFKEGYYFYVLSHNDDGTTNLIMDRNIYYDNKDKVGKVANEKNTGLVAWSIQSLSNDMGPINALNYLHDATKDWERIPNIKIDYEDENIDYNTGQKGNSGYGSIKTTGNTTIITKKDGTETLSIENLKTRMPKYSEVHGDEKCLTYAENNNQYGSCPLWLVNYLEPSEHYTITDGKVEITGIFGYWTLSSISGTSNYGWRVRFHGYLLNDDVRYGDSSSLRPVITLEL